MSDFPYKSKNDLMLDKIDNVDSNVAGLIESVDYLAATIEENQEDTNMYDERKEQMDRISYRISEVYGNLYQKGYDAYIDFPRPKTVGEAKKWLEEGNFLFDTGDLKDEADYRTYDHLTSYFRWGKKPQDKKALKAWTDTINKATVAARDQAHLSYEAGLKALHKLEAMELPN